MKSVSTVLFDLDGTLYDRDALVAELAPEQFRAFRDQLQHIGEKRFVERFLELDDHGYGTKEDLYRTIGNEWQLSAELQTRLLGHFWSSYYHHCAPSADTLYTLRTLKEHGKRLGVITNGSAVVQARKIDALAIRPFFDAVLVSETEGVRKPDPAIFARALERCSARAHEAVYVGDHPQIDVEGARAAGLIAVWKAVPYWKLAIAVPRIDRLSEILDLCIP